MVCIGNSQSSSRLLTKVKGPDGLVWKLKSITKMTSEDKTKATWLIHQHSSHQGAYTFVSFPPFIF